jgi:hypothetical protein
MVLEKQGLLQQFYFHQSGDSKSSQNVVAADRRLGVIVRSATAT